MRVFDRLESEVRSYIRDFPTIFDTAEGCWLQDEQGNRYLDFFAGAGTLNYGHNNPKVSAALIEHLQRNGIVHGLDKATVAKKAFLEKFEQVILKPRNMEYKFQFTGPTGTNTIETALKLARLVKRRSNVIAFTNAFHGLTMGSMSVTGNSFYRDEAFINRANVTFAPYDGYLGADYNTIDYLRKVLEDQSSGVDLPAAVILETVQAEGGINVASMQWLQELEKLCRDFDILLIVDDIQVGNGRTGTFFSFEPAGIHPDIVCLSKSIGGGLPLSLLLMRPDLDQWRPGEHTGTFRGNNLAFVASTQTLDYWETNDLADAVNYRSETLKGELDRLKEKYPALDADIRGRGLIYGLDIPHPGLTSIICHKAFEKGLVIETAGAEGNVLKFLPPLIIDEETLLKGTAILDEAIGEALEEKEALITGSNGHDTRGRSDA